MEDRNIILNELGIPLPKKNIITNRSSGRAFIHDLPDTTVDLLREVTHIDQILYDHAWSRRLHTDDARQK